MPGYTGLVPHDHQPFENEERLYSIYPRTESASGNRTGPDCEARPVSLYSWAQLERHSEHGLSRIGERLRDALGPSSVAPPYPQYHQKEQIITWVLERQVELARSTGLDVSLKSFGVPPPGM